MYHPKKLYPTHLGVENFLNPLITPRLLRVADIVNTLLVHLLDPRKRLLAEDILEPEVRVGGTLGGGADGAAV